MSPRLATFLMFVVNGVVVGTWVALIPGIQERLQIPPEQLGLVLLCLPLGALVAQQITGQLLVRVSSRLVLAVAGLILPLLLLPPVLAASPLGLAVVLLGLGFANTTMDVSMNAHGVALETAGGKSIFSGLHAGWSLGGIIGSVGVALAVAIGIEPVVEVVFAAGAVWLVVLVSVPSLGTGTVRTEGASGIHLPTRAIVPIAVLLALIAFVEAGLTDWGGVYLRQGVGAEPEESALAYAALSLGLFLGRLGGDWAKDRVGSVRMLEWGMLLTAVVMVVFLVVGNALVGLLGMVIAGVGIANAIPQLFNAAGRIPPHGPSLSAAFTFLTLAFMVTGPLIGATTSAFGISTALGLLVVASLVTVFLVQRVPTAETNPRLAGGPPSPASEQDR